MGNDNRKFEGKGENASVPLTDEKALMALAIDAVSTAFDALGALPWVIRVGALVKIGDMPYTLSPKVLRGDYLKSSVIKLVEAHARQSRQLYLSRSKEGATRPMEVVVKLTKVA